MNPDPDPNPDPNPNNPNNSLETKNFSGIQRSDPVTISCAILISILSGKKPPHMIHYG